MKRKSEEWAYQKYKEYQADQIKKLKITPILLRLLPDVQELLSTVDNSSDSDKEGSETSSILTRTISDLTDEEITSRYTHKAKGNEFKELNSSEVNSELNELSSTVQNPEITECNKATDLVGTSHENDDVTTL